MLSPGACGLMESIDGASAETSVWRGGMEREGEQPLIPLLLLWALEGALSWVGWAGTA